MESHWCIDLFHNNDRHCGMSRNLMRKYFTCCQISENFNYNSILNWSKTDLLSGRADFISRKHVVTAARYQNKLWYVITDKDSNVTMGPKPFKNLLQFLLAPSMSFYLDFILISSWFYPDFILILSRFYPDFILILSW